MVAVLVEAGEGAELLRHFGRGRIGDAGHDGRDGAANGTALMAVIGNAGTHQQAADIGEAQAQRAELVGKPRNLLGRELCHQHRDFEDDRPQAHAMLEGGDVEPAFGATELQEVERGKIARRVVEEHIFRARVGGTDLARGRAGMPVIDRSVELDAGIGRRPSGMADLVPQFTRRQRLGDLAGQSRRQFPIAVAFHRIEEIVGDAHRIVGILAGNGAIGLAVPIGVIGIEADVGVALARELDHPLDVIVGHHVAARILDGALERRVLLDLEAVGARAFAIDARLHDGAERLADDLRAGDECRDLLLFLHFPVDIVLYIGVIDIDDHHLRGAARRAARFDGARRPVADLEEAHQAGGLAAA